MTSIRNLSFLFLFMVLLFPYAKASAATYDQPEYSISTDEDPSQRHFADFHVTYTFPDTVNAGSSFTVDASVTYTNDVNAKLDWVDVYGVTMSLRISSEGNDLAAAADSSKVRLTPGDQYEHKFTLAAPEDPGDYYVVLAWKTHIPETTAYGFKLLEQDISWDTGSDAPNLKTLTVPQPHLVLVNRTIVPKEGEPLYSGDILTITFSWQNDGGSTAKNVQMKVADLPDGLTILDQTTARDLPAGSSGQWVIIIRGDRPGDYKFTMQLLSQNQELAEGAWTVTVSERPSFLEQYGLYLGLVVVIGIVAAVVIMMKRRKSPPTQPAAVAQKSSAQKFCINCRAPLPSNAKYCKKCGNKQ